MTKRTVAVAAALVLAGCGGGDEGLGKQALADAANTICADFTEQGKNLGQPDLTDPENAADYFGKAEDLAREQQSRLEALEPAEGVKADYDKLMAATDKATKLLADLAAAAEAKDQAKGDDLLQQLTPLATEVSDAADAIGAGDCAS